MGSEIAPGSRVVLWNWTKQDPVAASTWLQAQPAGPARDSAIGGLALATFDNDPAGAVTWATQLADDRTRTQAITLGLTEWLKRDPSAASAWAQENGVSLPTLDECGSVEVCPFNPEAAHFRTARGRAPRGISRGICRRGENHCRCSEDQAGAHSGFIRQSVS
ncbi:MAG: hypothetical protein ACKV19_15180 [Verrucomicrobiales bacterium]